MVLATALAASTLSAVALGTVVSAGPALAAPAGSEYPATWTVSGNVATGTTPSGVVVTATLTGPAAFFTPPAGALVFTGPVPGYFPATTTQALAPEVTDCAGPDCGSITYSFSRPVLAPVLYVGDVGSGAIDAGVFTNYHDSPITLPAGTFTLDAAGAETANMSVQNGGATVGITDPAAGIGLSAEDVTSCGTFGCGVYDINTPTQTVTSLTLNYGYAGTGPAEDVFSQLLGVTPATPALTLQQSVSPLVANGAGATATFSYLVTNTGNATLTGVHPADTAFSGTGTLSPITCPGTTLAAGQRETCTATYTLTQADADAGIVTSTATATGTLAGDPPVISLPSTAAVTIAPRPAVVIKQSASSQTLGRAGDTVQYHFLVTNPGNVALTGIKVRDNLLGLSAIVCPAAALGLGQDMTCTASYKLTQADVNAGKVTSVATVTGIPPVGPLLTSSPSSATVTIAARPALVIVKTASPGTFVKAGTTIHYRYLVANPGNVTVTGIKVDDKQPGLSPVDCPSATLNPGDGMICTATYVTTEADVHAALIIGTATVSGDPPAGAPIVSGPATTLVTALPAALRPGTPVPVTG